jgi:type I restriction enzyme M protein
VGTAADLPEAVYFDRAGRLVAPCTDGDIVGHSAYWRVLPTGFGEALTSLTVLRPLRNRGVALCEWLNAGKSSEYGFTQRISMDMPVPVEAILDPEFDRLVDDLHTGRMGLAYTMSKVLPNVFRESTVNIRDARQAAQTGASEARLIGELARPLEDPVWRAEWSYPHHIAVLARQYRIATSPAERKDALLKLGESVARSLGILALAILIRREGRFTRNMRDRFRFGASFHTWNRFIEDLLADGSVHELRELEGSFGPDFLTPIRNIRNDARHEYGVHALHELEEEVAQLEPMVVNALQSASWLSALHWNLVERCEYTGSGFRLIGQRLRGSHPDWEPFERSSIDPIAPNRIYVEGPSSPAPVSLSPIASVELCPTCRTWELFLLKEVEGKVMTLRSSKDHEIKRELE